MERESLWDRPSDLPIRTAFYTFEDSSTTRDGTKQTFLDMIKICAATMINIDVGEEQSFGDENELSICPFFFYRRKNFLKREKKIFLRAD